MAKKSPKKSDNSDIQVIPLSERLKNFENTPLVVGNGWSALLSVGLYASLGKKVIWIPGTGAHALPPLPVLEAGVAIEVWKKVIHGLGISTDEPQVGNTLREFRHKSFVRPSWTKSPTREMKIEVRDEMLWGPEKRVVPVFESRFDLSAGECEEKIRENLMVNPNVLWIPGVPVKSFSLDGAVKIVHLSNGEDVPCSHIWFADRWSSLIGMEGIPKASSLTRNRDPMGILQAEFMHTKSLTNADMQESFFGVTHKDPGEEIVRSVFGYFMDGGKKSVWTIFLAENESEDNHAIAKKYRRIKQTLERMFNQPEWLPEGCKDFFETVSDETVVFESDFIFADGDEILEPKALGKNESIRFLTDGCGPSAAAIQVSKSVGLELGLEFVGDAFTTAHEGAETQNESPNEVAPVSP